MPALQQVRHRVLFFCMDAARFMRRKANGKPSGGLTIRLGLLPRAKAYAITPFWSITLA